MKKLSTLVLAGAGAMLMAQSAQATLAYSNGDMLLGFRSASGSSNLEVDLGSITQILNIAGTGQILSFSSKFTSADITAGVGTAGSGTLNNAIWSVSAAVNLAGQVSGAAKNTLWLTSARGINSADINTQTTPWTTGSTTAQGNTVSPVLTIGGGFAAASGNAGSSTAAVIANGANSYADTIGANGDFGTFQGNIENTLGSTFVSGGSVARSDYYSLTPNGASTYLGYFELSQAGALSFVAVPESGTFAASIGAGLMALALMRAHRKSLAAS
ncbi:MAG: hypothetical protein EB141_02005 [Verrucomicrobia bacterium]|nr:hypothetical protein [Verrucomicrobiota bacterium]NBU07628.1 hypothetical protein [Pseudomonadota bacterium]NDA65624.1 hypothetical protein [Verrucomicrobiota bacterium]NDB74418.1 hypothetical protein [Verrucomicrobiota bacterium]NDE97321.1 hypothetical protein [Verrucomicrobiota bacterium]